MATEMTTTEETENDGDSDERGRESLGTRRLTSEDVRALAREDVSGDVARSVAERGDYAVSSDCTSGAGTGSSKQTTETSEETETFVEGTTTEMATEMTTTEETENDGDSDERGLWLNAVATLCHLTVRVARARDRASRQPRRPRRRTFVEGTTTEMATEMTSTEETENDGDSDERGRESLGTRRLTSEDVRALVREDVSGDVARSVAERGGYAVSSGCTSGAGTGSSKQTTETSEETETFCRGYHYGNGHRDDHDGGIGNDGDSDERGRESLGTRRHVSGDVTRSVAERGGYAVSSGCTSGRARDRASRQPRRPRRRRRFVEGTTTEMATEMTTTEETETTETVTSEDVRALAREDVTRCVAERGGDAVSSGLTSEDVRALAREEQSGDVTRSVAERGDYAVSSDCTSGAGTGSSKQTTETTEETETFCRGYHYGNGHRDDHDGGNGNDGDSDERGRESLGTRRLTSEDVRALAREDVSGDVARSVAERGGYAVSSGCTSGAGTGSSKQTTETSEETETFCRGYHYGNGHRDDHDGGNGKRRRQ
ncbi:hypothetical protein GN958_ATG08974 [Phytophthora infestans]|uniref:Uncharacterized protein n=1 Tax=Phytophthora infestans TaxID=4787 RepID=A0A8S9UUF8_PHYIN|nr:hypothetical protein GN958_ATG08974 [Phytophthora infestans]